MVIPKSRQPSPHCLWFPISKLRARPSSLRSRGAEPVLRTWAEEPIFCGILLYFNNLLIVSYLPLVFDRSSITKLEPKLCTLSLKLCNLTIMCHRNVLLVFLTILVNFTICFYKMVTISIFILKIFR